MKLIYEITVFPLISTLSIYFISNLLGEVLIRGQRLKEGNTFQTIKMKYKTLKPKKKEKNENIRISAIVSIVSLFNCCKTLPYEFIWILFLLLLQYDNFSYKCRISWCDAYWKGAVLLGRKLTSMRVPKGAAKVLRL